MTRSLALAHMLRGEYECVFAIQAPDAALKEQILNTCHGIIVLPVCPANEKRFGHELNAYISEEEIVVLDGYDFGTNYQENIKAKGTALVCIDDLHSYHFVADAVINQAGGVDPNIYSMAPYTKLYLGPSYALLRAPFLKAATNTGMKKDSLQVLLCMGGADPDNHTLRVAEEIEQLNRDAALEIVVGSAYKHHIALNAWIQEKENHQLHQNLSADAMSKLMRTCQAAVTSASGVAYEYAAVGGALFIQQTAGNQAALYNYLLSSGMARAYRQLPECLDPKNIASIGAALKKKQRAVFDGLSATRLKEVFSNLSLQTRLTIRAAAKNDLKLLFDWANDPVVRSHSFNTASIPLEIHTSWFNSKLDNPDSILYIAEVQGKPAAHIRFEITGQTATISYLIAKSFRGKGLGHAVLLKGVKKLLKDRTDINSVEGLVQQENTASLRAFHKAGFAITDSDPKHPKAYKFMLQPEGFTKNFS